MNFPSPEESTCGTKLALAEESRSNKAGEEESEATQGHPVGWLSLFVGTLKSRGAIMRRVYDVDGRPKRPAEAAGAIFVRSGQGNHHKSKRRGVMETGTTR